MRRIQQPTKPITVALLTCVVVLGACVIPAQAETASAPSLTISQLKVTSSNGQFVTLYNATNATLDMSRYQLEYFNNFDVSKATSSKLVALSGSVPPHGYYMVNDSELSLCYQVSVDSVSLGFSSTAGLVEVVAFDQLAGGSAAIPVLQDYIGWSKTAAAGAQTLPSSSNAFLQRQPIDAQFNPSIKSAGSGSWQAVQPDANNSCKLVTYVASGPTTSVTTGLNQLLPANEPPAIIVIGDDDSSSSDVTKPAVMPANDIGLMSPKITELLPNPMGTGTDKTDEFIELYNPNDKTFDLTGFSLQIGTTTSHSFTFPGDTQLPGKHFVAFYSADTGLSLSNTAGQARLLDPFDNSLSASGDYKNAKDGQAWALAKGAWYWTTKATPNSANIINLPATKKTKTAKATTAKHKTTTLTSAKNGHGTATGYSSSAGDQAQNKPVHLLSLVIIGGLALLYGAYEYRTDLANRLHRFRSHNRTGRNHR